MRIRYRNHHGCQIDKSIRDMCRNDRMAVAQMREIYVHRFIGQQMDRDRIAAKCIQNKHVEVLALPFAQFFLKGNPRVSQYRIDFRFRISHERKIKRIACR